MKKLKFKIAFLVWFLTSFATAAYGASCCGGSFNTPALITGDEKAQFTSSFTHQKMEIEVLSNGIWRQVTNSQNRETIKLEGAHILADRWQAGLSLPIIRQVKEIDSSNESSSGFGDLTTNFAYEFLPDWDYHPWRPKGIGFVQLIAPTGKSNLTSLDPQGIETRGRGFWTLGVGTVFTKPISVFDFQSTLEAHRSFEKTVENPSAEGQLTYQPGWGGSASLAAGWSRQNLRLGTSLTWNYEDAVRTQGTFSSDGSIQRYATATLMLNYLHQNQWASTLSYSDQSLIGSPLSTTLGKSITLSIQKRWLR